MGRIALPLAALLRAGVPSGDAEVLSAFGVLEGLPLQKTYCVAIHLFALDALWQRQYQEAREGPAALPLQAAGDMRRKMEELVRWLVEARVPGRGVWTYEKAGAGSTHDLSNTQFAVLGLHVGVEHGVAVPPEVFEEVALAAVRSLRRETAPFEFGLTAAPPLETALGLSRPTPERRYREVPGGWGYRASGPPPRGRRRGAAARGMMSRRKAPARPAASTPTPA
jgi:hypothetical protein